jgi:hypothetical protein
MLLAVSGEWFHHSLREWKQMQRIIAAWALAALLAPALLFSQGTYGRRTRTPNGSNPGVYDVPNVTFQGHLKALTKKELRIDVESEEQSITFRVTRKTHFMKDGKEIKLADVPLGTIVAVDASRDPDLKFSALNVVVSPPKPKSADQ